jgi:hypothetical protein
MDDNLHMAGGKADDHWDPFSLRGWLNAVTIFVLLAALIVLFAGWPIIVAFQNHANTNGGNTPGFNLGGINGSGQVPAITNFPNLIDQDTPANVRSRTGFDGKSYDLVFSDEFNTDGRTFYPGDDPFWEAVDLHCQLFLFFVAIIINPHTKRIVPRRLAYWRFRMVRSRSDHH